MKPALGLVEGADPDTVGTAEPFVLNPEPKALLSIYRPLENAPIVGDVDRLIRGLAKGDGLPWAVLGTFSTGIAEFRYAKLNGLIGSQGQISEHLAQSDPGAEFLRDQDSVAPQLS